MGQHAKKAPSDSARWMNCPGAIQATAGMDEDDSNAYSLEGDLAHLLLAQALDQGKPASFFLGKKLMDPRPEHEFTGVVPQDMVDVIQECLDYVDEVWDFTSDTDLYSEIQVNPEIPDCWGTLDLGLVSIENKSAHVMDLKYGKGVMVEVDDNPQLRIYLIGLLQAACERYSQMNGTKEILTWDYFDTLKMTIMQPRGHHPGGTVRSVEISVEELREFHRDAKVASVLANQPDASRVAGDKQCKWCAARPTCPAVADVTLGKAREIFGRVELDASEPDFLTEEQLQYILDKGDMIVQFINDVKGKHIQDVMAGGDGLGYKVVLGKSNRAWVKAPEETLAALKKAGLPKDAAQKVALHTPLQVEKALKAQIAAHEYTDATIKGKWKKLAALIFKPEGKPKLVPESAPGKAVVHDPSALFDPIEEDKPVAEDDAALAALL